MLLKLLTLPVSAPAAGIRFALEKVADVVDQQLNSEEPVTEELLELQLALEEGRIDERTYAAKEAVLFARLRDLRERRKALAREATATAEGTTRVEIDIPEELR